MWSKALRLVGSAVMLSAILACGSLRTEETAQSKAVRDRSRVLGLALMDDGTYQFRLCRLHQDYTAEVLANECINPFVNEDGTARVFNSVPVKPGTALPIFRNWATAFVAASLTAVIFYKIGRFYVKNKARDRIVGEVRLLEHKAKVNVAKGKNDFELVNQLKGIKSEGDRNVFAGTDFTSAITFVEDYSKKVEGNIKKAQSAIETIIKDADTLATNREIAHTALQEARATLGQAESGFNLNNELAQGLLHDIDALVKHTDELQTNTKDLHPKLQQIKKDLDILENRAESKAGMRLQLSDKEKESLYAAAANADDTSEAAKKYIRTWKGNKAELGLLDGKYFANVIDFAKTNIKTAQSTIGKMRASSNGAELTTEAEELHSLLSRVSTALKRAESGFSPSDEYVQGILQEIDKLVKQASELQNTETGLAASLQQMDTTVTAVIKRLQDKEELRPLLGNSEELEKVMTRLKYGKDSLVEKILRIEDVALPDSSKKTIKALREDISIARREIAEAEKVGDKVAENAAKEKLDEAEDSLRQRIKSYNPAQQEAIALAKKDIAAKIKASETTTAAVRPSGGEGILGKALGKLGDGIRDRLKFLQGFPWLAEDTLKYGRLRKITITDRDEVIAKLADGGEVKTIEVQKGAEKLAAQVVGVSAFLSLPLTAWSRYLPGYSLLTAERNWTAVTGGYATAKRIDDMQAILDGIAQATDSRVAHQALTFGLYKH